MKYFTLNKLWDLRAELDNAIISEDYGRIKIIKFKYKNLVESERWFNRAFICYNNAFWNDSQRASHNFANVDSILKNIENYEKRYIDGEAVSVKLKTPYTTGFLAQDIWVLRAMYDNFIFQSKNCEDEFQIQQNMILGKAIIERLVNLLQMSQVEEYYMQLRPILEEVRAGYANIYGDSQPRINYSSLADEYLES